MNSDDNKDSKPTSSDEFSVNSPDDSKEKDESEQEGRNNKRKYSEDQMVGSPDQDERPSKYRRVATPPDQNGQTSRVEATNQDANASDASETGLMPTPSYEELLLTLLDLHDEVEARKKERARLAREKRHQDGDYSDEEYLF